MLWESDRDVEGDVKIAGVPMHMMDKISEAAWEIPLDVTMAIFWKTPPPKKSFIYLKKYSSLLSNLACQDHVD